MDFSNPTVATCFLVDNGSLRPDAVLALRRLAANLSGKVGRVIEPVSLLHAHAVPAELLEGTAAEILEPAIRRRCATGERSFAVIPLFFGPSAALRDFIPRRITGIRRELPDLRFAMSSPVVRTATADDRRVARILAEHVRQARRVASLRSPSAVVLVDHGSPEREVGEVRDHVARQLAGELGSEARFVAAASMERREGAEYDFNEPLLERALMKLPPGDAVIAPLFFLPGRHAGPGGDIATIVRAAERRRPELRLHLAPLVGEHPLLIDVLADRYHEAIAALANS